jgi:hypothetical protein
VFGSFETPNGPEFHVGFWDGTSWQLAPGVDMNSTAFWLGHDLLSADLDDRRALYAAGVTLHAQASFRDTAPSGGATFGTSDGLAVRFLP